MMSRRISWLLTNRRKPWSDDELRLILAHAPTRANVLRLARAFLRTEDSIEMIYRWAGQSAQRLRSQRPHHISQRILRLRREVGWCAYGDNHGDREAETAP
jgi:hypothetical protein